ncbi:hypothetical protein [Pontibacter sp. 172403-2]|nr:hypothetical protein [Pontibacter sp. 172403-2]
MSRFYQIQYSIYFASLYTARKYKADASLSGTPEVTAPALPQQV